MKKKKAPSVIHCSDLSEPLRFNAGEEVKSSIPKHILQKVCDPLGPAAGQEEQRK